MATTKPKRKRNFSSRYHKRMEELGRVNNHEPLLPAMLSLAEKFPPARITYEDMHRRKPVNL